MFGGPTGPLFSRHMALVGLAPPTCSREMHVIQASQSERLATTTPTPAGPGPAHPPPPAPTLLVSVPGSEDRASLSLRPLSRGDETPEWPSSTLAMLSGDPA